MLGPQNQHPQYLLKVRADFPVRLYSRRDFMLRLAYWYKMENIHAIAANHSLVVSGRASTRGGLNKKNVLFCSTSHIQFPNHGF